MRFLLCAALLAALGSFAATAADVTGKWTGSFTLVSGDGHDETALLVLKQTGTAITGTIGPNEDEQHAITKGSIDGDKITLEVVEPETRVKLDLVLTGDRIVGDVAVNGEEGRGIKGKIDVKRAK
jgi:hypothetical protein